MKRGGLRFDEQQWAEMQARKREGWTTDCAKTAAAVDTTSGGVESRHAQFGGSEDAKPQNAKASTVAGVATGPLTHQRTGQMPRNGDTPGEQPGSLVAVQPRPPLERDVLKAVLAALRTHPRVAFVERMNSGAYKSAAGHYVRYGFVGCPDIIGMLRDGRFLAVEVKRPGGNPTGDQVEFLGVVARWHGVAFVAWGESDVARALA